MKYERWLIPETDDAAVEALMDAGYPYLVSTVLASRGVVTPEQAAAHLDRERSLVYSPFLMRDMDKAVARIDRALAGGETIAVFGDYDVDGITSTCLLTDYLRSRRVPSPTAWRGATRFEQRLTSGSCDICCDHRRTSCRVRSATPTSRCPVCGKKFKAEPIDG